MIRALRSTTHPPTRKVFARRIERRVLDYIAANHIFAPGDRPLVALSGGPDSTALLTILAALADRLEIHLVVAHFDHRLRGSRAASTDLQYATQLAARYGLLIAHGSGDVRAAAKRRGQSIEDAARTLRYAFLGREAKKAGANVVVTGHTLSDQAETVLLHIARGAGIDGLAGMRPRADWPFGRGPALARPLLCLSRDEVERYCHELGLVPLRDETNELLGAARNRIRLRVLPELQTINPKIAEALARLATSAAADAEYLDQAVRERLKAFEMSSGGEVALERKALSSLPQAIATRVVRLAAERVSGTSLDLEAVHVEAVLGLRDSPPGEVSLPHGLLAFSDAHAIHIRCGDQPRIQAIPETLLTVPGETSVAGWTLRCKLVPRPDPLTPQSPLEAYMNHRLARTRLAVRSRRRGDRLRPAGLEGEKKLQDIFVDAKVPARYREGMPLITDDKGIFWVVGQRIDERAAVLPGDRRVLHITAERTG